MRILHVNKFLYRRGGAEGHMFDVASLQRQTGHEVEFFGMSHPDNEPMRFAAEFPSQVDFDPAPSSVGGKVKGIGRMIYSTSAKRGIERVIAEYQPDLVHMHNIYHQLSPSILRPLKNIPAVLTLHDYKLACPTYQFLDHGKICEACLGGHFQNAIKRRCNNGSLAASTVSAVELALHTRMGAYEPVDVFSCPSHFLAGKMSQADVFPDRLRVVNNFVDATTIASKSTPGEGIVFAGRLSNEKGVDTLVQAVARLRTHLHIAGEGPERPRLEQMAQDLEADVRFHGRLPMDKLHDLVRSSAVSAIPSRWYENQPLAVLESFACGVPMVGTDLGGIPELITPGVDGELVPANDPEALADALELYVGNPKMAMERGQAGRRKVEVDFSPMRHLERLEDVYAEASARCHTSVAQATPVPPTAAERV